MKKRILIVDDDPNSLDVMVSLLNEDYLLLMANSGQEALRYAQSEPRPELILLDVVMPEMDGYEVCRQLKASAETSAIPVIFVTAMEEVGMVAIGFELGAVDYVSKPINPPVLLARVHTHLELAAQRRALQEQVHMRTHQLEESQKALRDAMQNLLTVQIAPGVYWLQIPEAGLRILCGCPGEVVKHLKRKGFINQVIKDGVHCETGPNAILLSEVLIQNGGFANLAEFPVLQMLYRQGMILPGHPNNTGVKPLLMGSARQVTAQMEYIFRGNYGLVSLEELLAAGVDPETADIMMRIKLKFAFGRIRPTSELVDTLVVDDTELEIRNGVTVARHGFNHYRFSYQGRSVEVDLNLPPDVSYQCPYPLGHYPLTQHYFAVLHIGEGDGWDVDRPSMGSIVLFQGRIYLVDASPSILHALTAMGIDISEVDGIFHTHAHDDHFGGLPALIVSDRKINYFATPLVRAAVTKKFAALMSLGEEEFGKFFQIHDLVFDQWNDCDGLEVLPLFSPHPLETNLFMFRAMDGSGYCTYAHWADLCSFKVLDSMTGTGSLDVPVAFINKVKADYFRPATLKKLDIGGGLVHGMAEDFRHDPSERLILAHIDRPFTHQEMEIGSASSFGTMDALITGHQDYNRRRSFQVLSMVFPDARKPSLQMLANNPIVRLNPGTIILRSDAKSGTVDLVLSGNMAMLDAQAGVFNHLSMGSMIGLDQVFGTQDEATVTYRAVSHCDVLRIPAQLLQAFLEQNNLMEQMQSVVRGVAFLRRTWLFGEQTTFARLARIVKRATLLEIAPDTIINPEKHLDLYLVQSGAVQMVDSLGAVLETLKEGDFFGERTYLEESAQPCAWSYRATEPSTLFRLRNEDLMVIPVVHWKMLEIFEKRRLRINMDNLETL